jgi:hypothetical protein
MLAHQGLGLLGERLFELHNLSIGFHLSTGNQ